MINVVVHHRLDDRLLQRLADVSTEIAVRVGLPAYRLAEASETSSRFPASDIVDLLPEADVLYAYRLPAGIPALAPRLGWIHFAMAGVDHVLTPDLVQSGITITTSSGIHAAPIGEYVLAALLMFAHRFPQAARQQTEHRWQSYVSSELAGAALGIVGYGHLGRHIADLGLAAGMRVSATRRSQSSAANDPRPAGNVMVLPSRDLLSLLAGSDYVVLTVPLVPETQRLIGRDELAAIKRTAFLVNVARGRVVDQAALVDALAAGAIAGACLDVFEDEPLPGDSPLWDMPNVIVTPHCAGNHERYDERSVELFRENLIRRLAGQPLLNEVDRRRGY